MLIKISHAAFVFTLFWGLIGSLLAADMVAVVIKTKGRVTLSRANEARAISVSKGQVLQSGDKLTTGPASLCAIKFLDDKSLLRMKPNSTCVIEGEKEGGKIDKNIIVEVGTFFASLFKPRGQFLVTTPTSVASVKGTKFYTIQKQDGGTIYIGIEGLIDILNDAGRVLLRAGQTALVSSKDRLPEVRLTNENEIPEEEEGGELRTIDIEFSDPQGNLRTLRLEAKPVK